MAPLFAETAKFPEDAVAPPDGLLAVVLPELPEPDELPEPELPEPEEELLPEDELSPEEPPPDPSWDGES